MASNITLYDDLGNPVVVSGEALKALTGATKQLATAWVDFDGTGTSPMTIANGGIKDSYNVSSVDRTATGVYTINFTTVMDNILYATDGSAQVTADSDRALVMNFSSQAVGSVVASPRNTGSVAARYASDINRIHIFGGKD